VAALRRVREAELVAVCDVVAARAGALGDECGVTTYTDYEDMLSREDVDVVEVLTPSGDHTACIGNVVRYGKHVIVEKPLALRLEDADAAIRACREARVRLFVVKQNRFNRPVQALRWALERGRFGKLVLGTVRVRWTRLPTYYASASWRGTRALDGGVLLNQASHHVDMLEWMMGDVESVSAMMTTRLAPIETEDTAVAAVRFRSGALGLVEATTATRPRDLEGSISILGEGGSVVIGGFAMDRLVTWSFVNPEPDDELIFRTHGTNPDEFGWSHAEYLRNVIATIGSGGPALVDGLEARKSLELIHAAFESAESGREVSLRPGATDRRTIVPRIDAAVPFPES
jgi:predicted dehydrogenase